MKKLQIQDDKVTAVKHFQNEKSVLGIRGVYLS